jgi:hypothetical protein
MKRIVIFGLVLFLLGCTKFGKNITMKGRVLNPITGEGIAGAEIKLWKDYFNFTYEGGKKMIKSTTSGADGSFEISKLSLSADKIQCNMSPAGAYYDIGWTKDNGASFTGAGDDLAVKKGKTVHADYYAVPYGNLKYTIKNTSCFDQSDTLLLNIKYQISNINISYSSTIYAGCFEYIGSVYSKRPMGWYYFSGYYKKNNVVTTFKDSIYITAGGYHEWVFHY